MKYKEIEKDKYIENKGDILACKFYHTLFPDGKETIGNYGIKNINNKEWEIFWVSKETETAYYGTPAEGIGLMDCMILKEDTREFLPEEIAELEKCNYEMNGIHQKVTIKPIVEKLKQKKKSILEKNNPIYFKIIKSMIEKYNGTELEEILRFIENLRENSLFLECLEQEGIKGWSGYDWAFDKQKEIEEENGYNLTYQIEEEIKQEMINQNNEIKKDNSQDLERNLKIKDEYLSLIIGIGFDYDGYCKANDLKNIIDEIVGYAKKAIKNDDSSFIYSGNNNKKYNILFEELGDDKND